ncbi:MAG: TnsA endonuclease N-terminal domain-containing protein [Planctomycetes bacterium]|nr:TnsA endonuclease N-terminal domain-containing protein [Planctomycetota bacterium]
MLQNDTSPSTFRLRRRTPGSFVLVPCPRLGRALRCQGQLEAAVAVVLAACPKVATVREQPLEIWYAWSGQSDAMGIRLLAGPPQRPVGRHNDVRYSYIVSDFLIEMIDGGQRLIEVKPSDRLHGPVAQRKLAVASMFAAQRGWGFHVVTERELFSGPLVNNLRLLARYRTLDADQSLMELLEQRTVPNGVPFSDLVLQVSSSAGPSQACAHLRHLLAVGQLSFDPTGARLGDQTLVFPGGVIQWDPFDSVWAPSGCWTAGPTGSSAN